MRHRLAFPLLRLVALAAFAALFARGPCARADGEGAEGTTKSFPDKNFSLSVPKGWDFEELTDEQKASGYVCRVHRPVSTSIEARAYCVVVAAGTTALEGFLAVVKENKAKALKDIETQGPEKISWAGVDNARFLRVAGMDNGSKVVSRVFGAIVEGRYHQLEIRGYNGAEDRIGEEMQAIFDGYKFLKGVEAKKPDGGASPPPDAGAGGGTDGAAPGTSLTQRFEKLGLTWTLPTPSGKEDEPSWSFGTSSDLKTGLGRGDTGLLAVAGLTLNGESHLQVLLLIEPSRPGLTPKGAIGSDQNFQHFLEEFDGVPIPNLDEEVRLGNWRGSSKSLTGKDKEGKPHFVRVYFASLKGVFYQLRILASDKAEQKYSPVIKAALAGLKWDDTNEGVRGPWLTPFSSTTEERADRIDGGAEVPVKVSTWLTLKKPAAFGRIKYVSTEEGFDNWVFAAEARKPGAYLFVGIQRFEANNPARITQFSPETMIDEFEGRWKTDMSDAKTLTQRANKANKSPGSFASGKGFAYQFEATGEGQPFVEQGWVVTAGKSIFWVRAQFGGKDAVNLLSPEWKSLQRTIKFD